MTPDPDHQRVTERLLHVIDCPPSPVPYERCGKEHRERHKRFAKQLLAGYQNSGYTLTSSSDNQEERP